MIFEVCAYLDNKDLIIETIGEEKIDLIISEIDLNGSSAQDILRILKKNKIDIPVVIFTSLSNEIKSLKLLKKGASGFLTKKNKYNFLNLAGRGYSGLQESISIISNIDEISKTNIKKIIVSKKIPANSSCR